MTIREMSIFGGSIHHNLVSMCQGYKLCQEGEEPYPACKLLCREVKNDVLLVHHCSRKTNDHVLIAHPANQ